MLIRLRGSQWKQRQIPEHMVQDLLEESVILENVPDPLLQNGLELTQFYAISFQLAFVLLPGLKKQPVEKVSRIHVLHIHQWDNF